jgi:predicted metal-binding protein
VYGIGIANVSLEEILTRQGVHYMKKPLSALLLPLLLIQMMPLPVAFAQQEAAKTIQESQRSVTPLSNLDVLRMVKADFTPETIIAQIKASPCDFATMPAALQQLKEERVPDAVILAMVMAPKSAPSQNHSSGATKPQKNIKIKIPNGVTIEVEAPFTVSSQDVRKGDAISFRVVNPVKVDGVLVIAAGATATARVVQASRGGHFGKAGRLAWTMEDVTAVDGTRIPLQSAGRIVGDSKGAKVATQMIIMAVALPLIAPVALLTGFKRGENAILPAGKRMEVLSQGETSINALAP